MSEAAPGDRRIQLLAGAVFAALVVVVLIVLVAGRHSASGPTGDGAASLQELQASIAGLDQDGITLGDPKAPVTIIEFIDFQCPFCRAHQVSEQPAIIRQVVRTGQARLQVQPLAFLGADSSIARTVYLRLAAKGHGWDFLNAALWNQGPENSGYVTADWLRRITTGIPGITAADLVTTADATTRAGVTEAEDLKHTLMTRSDGTPYIAIGRTGAPPSSYRKVDLGAEGSAAASVVAAVRQLR